MNKIITVALIAGGLLLLDSPEAAAHKEVRNSYQSPAHFHFDSRRAKQMPFWLKRNKSFRKWYRHTRLRRNKHLGWHRLFSIYRWERALVRQDRRGYNRGYYRGYDRSYGDSNDRRRNRH